MFSRASKLRFRRSVRMRQKQVSNFSDEAEQQLDQHFFRRLERLVPVRRFVVVWMLLSVLLIGGVVAQTFALSGYYQRLVPAPGGLFTEGIVGEFTTANPIYSTTAADRTVAKLVFSGLLTYDKQNQLVGDLAESWQVDPRGQVYTVRLRKDVNWHDGKPFTANDVIFTYATIQNADAQSPLRESWKGVKVDALDPHTVRFTLDNPLASFIYSLTNGIVPEHLLQTTSPENMRTAQFNTTNPIGTGPFKWRAVEVASNRVGSREVLVALEKYDKYHIDAVQLDGFTVRVFENQENMLTALNNRELTAVAGLIRPPETLPDGISTENFTQTAATMAFYKTTNDVLKDKVVRQALTRAVDGDKVRAQLGYAAPVVDAPLLRGQLGYDKTLVQPAHDPVAAATALTEAGWVLGKGGVRAKNGQQLAFTLVAERNKETEAVSRTLRSQWEALGAQVTLDLQNSNDFQTTLSQHSYDVLLRGISIGIDPDVFVYWHSSQAGELSSRLNFSEYASTTADASLEAARTRIDPALRSQKLKPFLQAWSEDVPALGLYQPRSLYIVRGTVANLTPHDVNSATDRFANVHEWMIRRVKTTVD